MSAGRILLLLIVVGTIAWLVRSSSSHFLAPSPSETGSAAPAERARRAARAAGARNSQTEAASHDLESQATAGSVGENMTPEQVRTLLGQPDSVDTETTDAGAARERWTYRRAGKTVLFENGIVVRVE